MGESTAMLYLRTFLAVAALWLATSFSQAEEAAAPDAAAAPVAALHETLLESMQAGAERTFDARYQALGRVLQETFDFNTISRVVTGRFWREFDDAQKLAFMTAFAKLSAATYADRFDTYKGEVFRTLSIAPQRRGAMVRTEIVKGSGGSVSLDYMVQPTAAGYRIINVIADGVSDLSVKRAEYTDVLRTSGLEALIASIDAQRVALENRAKAADTQ